MPSRVRIEANSEIISTIIRPADFLYCGSADYRLEVPKLNLTER